jgi:hypothetical protein
MLTSYPLPQGDRTHWNYFLALEDNLIECARFVEFSLKNKDVYSIEFAQILMAAASEVDVLSKLIVSMLEPAAQKKNIDDYRSVIIRHLPAFANYKVALARYGLRTEPWMSWTSGTNPTWWRSYNDVKHERDQHFPDATLENVISALAGLLVTVIQYYRLKLAPAGSLENKMQATTSYLQPSASLLHLDGDFYAGALFLSSE